MFIEKKIQKKEGSLLQEIPLQIFKINFYNLAARLFQYGITINRTAT